MTQTAALEEKRGREAMTTMMVGRRKTHFQRSIVPVYWEGPNFNMVNRQLYPAQRRLGIAALQETSNRR
jgi:hypothetical protein